jgi:peptide/nickel transport system ATP-binding protein
MIFQEPMSSLNPVFTVGSQMREVVRIHRGLGRRQADLLCADMLRRVRMPDPETVLGWYPHQLSGGMRQRVMIATALVLGPELLIADEPTTALDVTVQGQVLAVLTGLSREMNVSVLLITHDMGVVAQVCDRVAVMYAGRVVETAPVRDLFADPLHSYTRGLIAAIPDLDGRKGLSSIPGTVPDLSTPPPGCRFHPRCPGRMQVCREESLELFPVSRDPSAAPPGGDSGMTGPGDRGGPAAAGRSAGDRAATDHRVACHAVVRRFGKPVSAGVIP